MKKILIILGNPKPKGFCDSLAGSYEKGAKKSGAEVKRIDLGKLKFDPILRNGYSKPQKLEKDLKKSQEDIKWANHLVFIYPVWWATMPALLKGFIERVFLPGFAFNYTKKFPWLKRHLKNKSSRMIVTMNSSVIFNKIFLENPGHKIMRKGILKFCGISPVKTTTIGNVRGLGKEKRIKWLKKIQGIGYFEGR